MCLLFLILMTMLAGFKQSRYLQNSNSNSR